MTRNHRVSTGLLALCAAIIPGLHGQSTPSLAGDYAGVLAGALHLKLHIAAAPDGSLTGTLDSVDQGATGIPCADFKVEGGALTFRVPAVNGVWKGAIVDGGKSLEGKWSQGPEMTLNFTRDTFIAAEKPSPIDGVWLGSVQAAGRTLRAQLKLKSDRAGNERCAFDSLDQGALDWECANVKFEGGNLSFDVPKVRGRWSGKLSAEGDTLKGEWRQEGPYQLDFTRRNTETKPSPGGLDAALAPVKPEDMGPVLERDLAAARTPVFSIGPLAEGAGVGVVVGVVRNGVRRVYAFGPVKNDSLFEIGSVTKTFTGLILARMAARGDVKLDEPVRELLPPGTAAKPEGAEITLLDLTIQHSGLPRMPGNFRQTDPRNPYADYKPGDLYKYISSHGVAKPANPPFLYSNLGVGLLGQALANRAGLTYPALFKKEIADPLGLKDTTVALTSEQKARFAQGHDGQRRPTSAWDLDALAGAGALRSTAGDMLTYLEAQLHPDKFPALAASMEQTHVLRSDAGPGMRIGFGWIYPEKDAYYWHNGGTGGFSSYAFFDTKNDCAGVVLTNITVDGNFADRLGLHVRQRLLGEAAVPVAR
ncbi:MAG: beta-lactamase family protein [Acidobacteria bacterium]|nr:beta-lactamase family protein [Acidobacteriota bacterium]